MGFKQEKLGYGEIVKIKVCRERTRLRAMDDDRLTLYPNYKAISLGRNRPQMA